MNILAIDTSTRAASVAVLQELDVVAEIYETSGDHSDRLIAIIDDTLRSAGVTLADIDALAIGAGPGSFTGLRIGMATAKGLAFAADKPLWAVSSLAAVATQLEIPDGIERIAVVADARRNEIFLGVFDAETLAPVGEERVLAPGELGAVLAELGALAQTTVLVGNGLDLYKAATEGLGQRLEGATNHPTAAGVAAIALAGSRIDVRTIATPVYIRPSEAEIRFPNGNPGGTFAPRRKNDAT